jgi:hypothetical protein
MALKPGADDVARLFRELVYTLADARPAYLHQAFQVSELYQDIVPYRLFRSRLQFDTNEDYEMALLRLLAGQRGYAVLEPAEARDVLAQEAEAINPFPGAFRDFAGARVTLDPEAVRRVLEARDSYAPAPPPPAVADPARPPTSAPAPAAHAPPDAAGAHAPLVPGSPPAYTLAAGAASECPSCRRALPRHRAVVYCPYCGRQVAPTRCPRCDTELEADWTYCITCGHTVKHR